MSNTFSPSKPANAGMSLRTRLEDLGVRDVRPFLDEYHQFASNCKARNPLKRPCVFEYVRRVEANGFKPLSLG